ncbi:hypothetical protein TSAR_011383 [Trichomalopsis sarcophagae]|uniref:SKP1 component POZ domain-containing protein n=1 Tax=Trichomalopsis sarcophagae TaxID=543379 RepID=A0A232F4G0_9HYME|nr:hypothetical protein TSAR_011383 [Trichomalopsis sarcophagae]
MAQMSFIKVITTDGIFKIDLDIAMRFKTIKTLLDDLGIDPKEVDEEIPLPYISSEILSRIVEWASHHRDDPVEDQEEDIYHQKTYDLSDWDRTFLETEREAKRLIPLIIAVNFLDIDSLMGASCQYVWGLISNKKAHEVRQLLKLDPIEKRKKSTQNTEVSPVESNESNEENIGNSNENAIDLSTSNRPAS